MQCTSGKNCLSLLQLRNRKICINSALSYQHWASNQCWLHVSLHRISQAIPFTLTFYCTGSNNNELVAIKYSQTCHCSFFVAFSESDQEPRVCQWCTEWPGSGANEEEKDHWDFCNLWNAWSNLWRRSREAINDGTLIQSLTMQQQQLKTWLKTKI